MKPFHTSGFTLIEILVAVGIIGFISIVITQVFVSTTRSNAKVEVLKDIKQNGDFALGTMIRMIRNAYGVQSCTGTDVTITNRDGLTTTFGCVEDNGVLRIASTSGAIVDFLTSEQVTIAGASCAAVQPFTCQTPTGLPSSVSIQFQLTQRGSPVSLFDRADTTFQSNVTLRNE